jgi:mediator of RNA polymerase II transcription subunit 14
MGKTATGSAVIRPSKRIIYDTTEAVVSFLSENVNTCVDEFLEEWARVSKMVVIAREGSSLTVKVEQSLLWSHCLHQFSVAQMAKRKKWRDVRLLSFDLQTVEFAYSQVSLIPLILSFMISFIRITRSLSPVKTNFHLLEVPLTLNFREHCQPVGRTRMPK